MNTKIIVKATVGGDSAPLAKPLEEKDIYYFEAEEIGVLELHRHRQEVEYYTATIVWDNAPKRLERDVFMPNLQCVGIQADGYRFIVSA